MQDRYAGDIGDFAKFGLLRALSRECLSGRSLAVIWYRIPDEQGTGDGRHTDYLTSDAQVWHELRGCDEELALRLKDLVGSGERSVEALEGLRLLPEAAGYYSGVLSFRDVATRNRAQQRAEWLAGAKEVIAASKIVFLDPDNGLETPSTGRLSRRAPKYAFKDEVKVFAGNGRSLVVYQHACRKGTFTEQAQERLRQLEGWFPKCQPFALLFRRVSARAFLFVPAPKHARTLADSVARFLDSGWGKHFERVKRDAG